MEEFLHHLRWPFFIILAGGVAAFVIQNTAIVELQLLIWTVTTRHAFLILAATILGFCLGWVFGRSARHL